MYNAKQVRGYNVPAQRYVYCNCVHTIKSYLTECTIQNYMTHIYEIITFR